MEDWKKKADGILSSGRIIIVIGAVDTGKTTLVAYLANRAAEGGKVVGIVDTDIGQSDIGPPTTIGLGMIKEPVERLQMITPTALYFVGSLTPKGHLLPMVVGTRRMVEHAFQLGAQKVIIDTTGLISQDLGFSLKTYKIENIGASVIVSLQRGNEAEHILKVFEPFEGMKIYRLKVPREVKRRSIEERRINRENSFKNYFKGAGLMEISFKETPILTPDPDSLYISPHEFEDLLVALLDEENRVMALGIIEEIDPILEAMKIRTPLFGKRKIALIKLSSFSLKSDFKCAPLE